MSAGVLQAALPHYNEALCFWSDLTSQCQQQVTAVNFVVSTDDEPIEFRQDNWSLSLVCAAYPSTQINLALDFESWGPQIRCSVRGEQAEDVHFYPEYSEFMVANDEDDALVAITWEGKSLSPHDLSKFVLQHFRRSYPGVTLP